MKEAKANMPLDLNLKAKLKRLKNLFHYFPLLSEDPHSLVIHSDIFCFATGKKVVFPPAMDF